MKLSHSSISTYNTCPKSYEFKYIQRLPQAPKGYFSLGKSVHSALEFMYQGERCPDLDAVLTHLDTSWLSAGYKDEAAERKAKREAVAMINDYYAKHAAAWRKPLAIELKFDITVDHVRLTGFIDRIDADENNTLHVLDYKTGRELEPGRALDDEQLTMYQMAVEALELGEVGQVSLMHVPTSTWHTAPARDTAAVDRLKRKIVDTADAIARGEYPAKPSEKACGLCDYKASCPAWAPL